MRRKYKALLPLAVLVALIVLAVEYLSRQNIEVLNPKGPVAQQERTLMITAVLLMLIVVIPVFVLTFFISWRYRESNKKSKYQPDWDHSRKLEAIWWLIPSALILALSIISWNATHSLVPGKPLASSNPTMTLDCVALDWKWLFIYPRQDIATVNYITFPTNTPVNFEITSDAPMNSFWVPQLGGQIYAMAGMVSDLNLMATSNGTYRGSSANISGVGFANMNFSANTTSQHQFELWVNNIKRASSTLNDQAYATLAAPSQNGNYQAYASTEPGLFQKIVLKYMSPSQQAMLTGQFGNPAGVSE